MKTYAEKLRDPRWQRKRLEILERDNFKCRHCMSKDKTLHIHHRIYRKGKMPWDYEDHIFVTLCEDCHKNAEETKENLLLSIGINPCRDANLMRLASALTSNPCELTFLGWAAESLADCIAAKLKMISHGANIDNEADEIRMNMNLTMEHLHRDLFHSEENYPNCS
jgi:hypothetical protein